MPALKWTDEELTEGYKRHNGSVADLARELGTAPRTIHERIAKIEAVTGQRIRFGKGSRVHINRDTRPNPIELQDGCIFVASDCHYWPGDPSAAHRAFVKLIGKIGPDIVLVNGDEFDGASISRHPRNGWEQRPTVAQEVESLRERMGEIKAAAGRAHLLGSYGNHTMRWDTYISAHASGLEGVHGTRFDDIVPAWSYAWAWMVNGHTLIKHRLKGGIHATWNNTAEAQVNTVTGHLHNLRVTPRSTMGPTNGGNLYGVDAGMLADPWGPQFSYVEAGPRNWRSGFAVLTFKDGVLMPPELCQVVEEDAVWFRGNRIEV